MLNLKIKTKKRRIVAVALALLLFTLTLCALPAFGLGANSAGVRNYYNHFDYFAYISDSVEGEGTTDVVYKWRYNIGGTEYPMKVVPNGDGSLLSLAPLEESYPSVPANVVLTSLPISTFGQLFRFFGIGDMCYLNYGTIGQTDVYGSQFFRFQYMTGDGSWHDLPINTPFTVTEDLLRANIRAVARCNYAGDCNVYSLGAYRLLYGDYYDTQYVGKPNKAYAESVFVPYSITADDYQSAYNDGYQNALKDNSAELEQAFQDGKTEGVEEGYNTGYANGYADGTNEGGSAFYSLAGAVINVPIQGIRGLMNFDILGVNMLSFFGSILTLLALFWLIRLVV